MSTDNNIEATTLEEMISMSDEDFTKATNPEDKKESTEGVGESEDTNDNADKSPEKDTKDKSVKVTEEEDLGKLSKEEIIEKLKKEREGNLKAQDRINSQKEYITRRDAEVGALRKSVKDREDQIKKLTEDYESKYISDPSEARKISRDIDKLEEQSKQDSEKIKTIEKTTQNFEAVLDIHPDIEKFIPSVVEMWRKDPDNKSEADQKLISDFEANYKSMIMNPSFMIKEINKVKIEEAKKNTTSKKETPIQRITKAADHSTFINGSASESSSKAKLTLQELVELDEESFKIATKG